MDNDIIELQLTTPTAQNITDLEHFILNECEQIELQTDHIFIDGVLLRRMIAPAGSIITGHYHNEECINVVIKGRMLVWTERGATEIVAPAIFTSGRGVKRVGIALEETHWCGVFKNENNAINEGNIMGALTCLG